MQLCLKRFYEDHVPTIGGSFYQRVLVAPPDPHSPPRDVRLDLWDTAGQERFSSMAPIFYRDAQAALVTFDVTSHYSFDRAQWWVDELKQKGPKDVTIILVGNKVDIVHGRVVSAGKAEAYVAQHPELLFYTETSAKTGFGVTELFERVAREVVARGTAREERPQQGQIKAPAASSSLYGSLCCST